MYAQQYLIRERQQEWIKRAERERTAQRVADLRRLEKQRERAERKLLQVWRRVDQARSAMSVS